MAGRIEPSPGRVAGKELLAECRTLNGCRVGAAKLTGGYRLPARHVIHTVGPVYRDGRSGEPAQLASCYRASLALAREHGLETIAFPAISTGVYRYPLRDAAEVAVATIAGELARHELPRHVTLCTFDLIATKVTTEVLEAYLAREDSDNGPK